MSRDILQLECYKGLLTIVTFEKGFEIFFISDNMEQTWSAGHKHGTAAHCPTVTLNNQGTIPFQVFVNRSLTSNYLHNESLWHL